MLVTEIVGVAMAAIRANALRSVLTTLGIIIGVAAVITMVALGEGAQRQVQEQIARMGTNVISIRPQMHRGMGGIASGENRLYAEDAEALRDDSNGLLKVAPEISSRLQVSYLRWNSSNEILGTWPEYFEMNNMRLAYGRIFDQGEVQGRRRVAVLGSDLPEDLGGVPPALLVGRTIQIRGRPFEVIGILEEKGSSTPWLRPDSRVYVPLSTAQYRLFGGRDRLNGISVQVPDASLMDRAYAEIDRILRRQHRIRPGEEVDFQIRNATDLLNTFQEANRTFTYLLAGIAAVSLLVGGIGIMNIMLVSVTERTREIGVRKAMGATRRNILLQFLVESLTLCLLGGVLGVAAGWGGAVLVSRMTNWVTFVAPESVAVALAFSAGIGLFFGIWPAQRAAKLDPIVALRYE